MRLRPNHLKHKLRLGTAFLVSMVPSSRLRVVLYRALLGYRIAAGARIGLGTVIAVAEASIGRARIGRGNRFYGPFSLHVGDGASIGPGNSFSCGLWARGGTCRLGSKSVITRGHFFDVYGRIELGENSWIAGRHSQFWTHGAGATDPSIVIGCNCYIASAVRFAPGAWIGDGCLVALGSVVTKRVPGDNLLIGGVPARVIKENHDWRSRLSPAGPEGE